MKMLPGIGVFGTGSVVRIIVPFLRAKGFVVVAIWGRTPASAQNIAKELSIPFYTSKVDEVLLRKDVDLIFVLCSPHLHAQISVKALGIGKHVLCDRPAGICQNDALKMVKASQYYPSLISIVNHSLRFLPAFTMMRKCLRDNYVGKRIDLCDVRIRISSLIDETEGYDWTCDERMGGGILTLVGSHVIDLLSFLTGLRATRVHGVIRTFESETARVQGIRRVTAPDFATFQLELGGPINDYNLLTGDRPPLLVTVQLMSSNQAGAFNQELVITGEAGALWVKGGDLHGRRNNAKEECLYLDVEDLENPTGNESLPRPYMKGLLKMVGALREAFQSVEDRRGWVKEPVADAATFQDGQYVQAVMEALRKSSRHMSWERVILADEEEQDLNNPLLTRAAAMLRHP
ncbi:glucose-fructose oxidoreductase domain-containing protein 2 [Cloeon dipterum]|uniref:glucose-fructose oxidoreductase domain-containing protein 2 n=1 Tax=Cloeon dipterum TaxID=197152 RepID=UPI0032201331